MNDHDAMTAINSVLDRYYRGEITQLQAIAQVSTITGANAVEHQEAKGAAK